MQQPENNSGKVSIIKKQTTWAMREREREN